MSIKIGIMEKDGVEYATPTEMDLGAALSSVTIPSPDNLGWEDLVSDITVRGGTRSPSWSLFRNGIYAYSFPNNTEKECWLSFHMKHDYAVGTDVFIHIHAATNTTLTGVVRFGVEYTVAKGYNQGSDSEFSATSTEYIEYNISANSQYRHLIAENSVGISMPKLETDSIILVRLFRDTSSPNDTFNDDIFILNCDVHYQCDRTATKNRNPNFYT